MNPLPVDELEQRTPKARMQNVPLDVTPDAVEDYDYYPYSVAVGPEARYLSVWGFPWWTGDHATGYGAGGYGAGPYGEAANQGDYGALRFGRGKYGTGGYA